MSNEAYFQVLRDIQMLMRLDSSHVLRPNAVQCHNCIVYRYVQGMCPCLVINIISKRLEPYDINGCGHSTLPFTPSAYLWQEVLSSIMQELMEQ